jgi:hypothetical protein
MFARYSVGALGLAPVSLKDLAEVSMLRIVGAKVSRF